MTFSQDFDPEDQPNGVVIERYRVAGDAAGVSTAFIGPGANGVVGNTVTIPGGFEALAWRFLRATVQDPGDGSVASLELNGMIYYPGSGPQYQEVGEELETSRLENIATPQQFTCTGACYIEIVVQR